MLSAENGAQPTLAADAVSAVVGARHPTLNTKPLFKLMVEKKASDLFFTPNAPIKIKIEGQILPVNKQVLAPDTVRQTDRKSTRLNSSHLVISYAVFCLKKKKKHMTAVISHRTSPC